MKYGAGADSDLITVNFSPGDTLDPKLPLYTSTVNYKRFSFPYASMRKSTIYIESAAPLPLTIRAILPELTTR